MARPIAVSDARQLAARHRNLIQQMEKMVKESADYERCIQQAVNVMQNHEVYTLLQNVSIDEINRDKQGIRVKTLRDAGFTTMADLHAATWQQLESVRGIGQEMAYTIKQQVNAYVNEARANVKIKLSVDHQTPAATHLAASLFLYKETKPWLEICKNLLDNDRTEIEKLLIDLTPATQGIKWIFTGRAKKVQAAAAAEQLQRILSDNYGKQSTMALQQIQYLNTYQKQLCWNDYARDSIAYFNILEEICPGVLGNEDAVFGLPEELAEAIANEPLYLDGLRCTLRRYQEWGVKYILHQKRVLLGDEMGLGKTVQAIASMVSLKNNGASHFMVICPASVITNWCREIQKFCDIPVYKVHGEQKTEAIEAWIQKGGAAVTTYESTGAFSLDDTVTYAQLIVDEAHYIKNPSARRTINTKRLCRHAERILFMTGTALENRVEEMLTLIKILQPAIAAQVQSLAFMSAAPQFREKIAPVYYRRKREDVLTELPDLIEKKDWCTMSSEEERIYEETILKRQYAKARRVSWNVPDLETSSKAKRLIEIVESAESSGRKVIVFSFFLETIRRIGELLGERSLQPINGSIPPQRRQEIIDEFAKAPAGTVLLAQIMAGGTGLNIQTASVVVICEPQFKPSIENQAISRAYRMGQTRNVLVHRLLCDETIDEQITDLLEEKQAIFDAYADESAAAQESFELDEKTVGAIMEKERVRIEEKRISS